MKTAPIGAPRLVMPERTLTQGAEFRIGTNVAETWARHGWKPSGPTSVFDPATKTYVKVKSND